LHRTMESNTELLYDAISYRSILYLTVL